MALGILSTTALDLRLMIISELLMWCAGITFVGLTFLLLSALLRNCRRLRERLIQAQDCFSSYALVAALVVLAVRLLGARAGSLGLALWVVATGMWGGISVLVVIGLRRRKAPLHLISGGRWLLFIVATQSLAVLGAAVASDLRSAAVGVTALLLWSLGLLMYPAVGSLVVRRLHSRGLRAVDFTPDHWILMGALAISTFAGTRLAESATRAGFASTGPALSGMATVTWVLATLLYVPFAATSVRRWIGEPSTRRYDAEWWSAIFPLGMYAACSFELGTALGHDQLNFV
ncbi:MAG: tellurite resistance/C4-dicarboxylate transporter family protein, partial [Acidimicrobiales bacterium]